MFGGDAAKGRDGARKIVGFALDSDHPAVVELHATGVIFEGGDDQRMVDFFRRRHQTLEQPEAFPGGVTAVIAPRLHQDFDFGVGVRPPLPALVLLNDFQLRKRRIPGASLRKSFELIIGKVDETHSGDGVRRACGPERCDGFAGLAHKGSLDRLCGCLSACAEEGKCRCPQFRSAPTNYDQFKRLT